MRNQLRILTMMALASYGSTMPISGPTRRRTQPNPNFSPTKAVQPKGTTEYHFNKEGEIINCTYLKYHDVVFKCFALKKANAEKKYQAFLKTQKSSSNKNNTPEVLAGYLTSKKEISNRVRSGENLKVIAQEEGFKVVLPL